VGNQHRYRVILGNPQLREREVDISPAPPRLFPETVPIEAHRRRNAFPHPSSHRLRVRESLLDSPIMAQFMCRYFLFLLAIAKASQSKVHTVLVGYGGNFAFDPSTTYADPNDTVIFKFFPTNHSVVRGVYTGSTVCGSDSCNPCVPYELINPGQEGFESGNILTQTTGDVLSMPFYTD
jgi:hypothetical protein